MTVTTSSTPNADGAAKPLSVYAHTHTKLIYIVKKLTMLFEIIPVPIFLIHTCMYIQIL